MVEKFRARLLEVKLTHEPPRWGWEVLAGDEVLSSGSHDGQIKATFDAYSAMFLLLAILPKDGLS
jgi:hypothetical protein